MQPSSAVIYFDIDGRLGLRDVLACVFRIAIQVAREIECQHEREHLFMLFRTQAPEIECGLLVKGIEVAFFFAQFEMQMRTGRKTG